MKHNRYSDLKILNFPEKIQSFRDGRVTAPIYVRIKPTNRCNHGCRWCCYSDGSKRPKDLGIGDHLQSGMHEDMREQDTMPTDKAMELVADLKAMGVRAATLSGGGEPLAHKGIVQIMDAIIAADIDLSMITNGQLLTGLRAASLRKAKWVRVSIDYWDAPSMVASRNVEPWAFQAVMNNLGAFAASGTDCDLGVNFIVTRENASHLFEAASMLKVSGVANVRFSPVYVQGFQAYHRPIEAAVLSQIEHATRLTSDRFSVSSTYDLASPTKGDERPFKRCFYAETVPVIGADLGVYTCHNGAFSEKHRIGSIANRSFRDLWESPETAAWFTAFRPCVSCAGMECANHNKVALINQIVEPATDAFV